jgi:hypothetical protein
MGKKVITFLSKTELLTYSVTLCNDDDFLEYHNIKFPILEFKDYQIQLCTTPLVLTDGFTCDFLVIGLYEFFQESKSDREEIIKKSIAGDYKLIISDIQGEGLNTNLISRTKELLQKTDSYLISQRDLGITGSKIYFNLHELSLFYYYYLLTDNIFLFPELDDFEFKNKKYDFIVYLGLDELNMNYNIRKKFIDEINFKDTTLLKPNEVKTRPIQKQISENFVTWPGNNLGAYYFYNLFKSEEAKIKIVFETIHTIPRPFEQDVVFLSEKTLKCLLHTQPYILLLPIKQRRYLETTFGFKFLGPEDPKDLQKYISNICDDVDDWITKNKKLFSNNKKIMNTLLNNKNANHVKIFKKITLKNG